MIEPPSQDFTLSATALRIRGRHVVDLAWSGTSAAVDVYRDGSVMTTLPPGSLSYRDAPGGRGSQSYVYVVCEENTAVCTNEEVVAY